MVEEMAKFVNIKDLTSHITQFTLLNIFNDLIHINLMFTILNSNITTLTKIYDLLSYYSSKLKSSR